MGRVAKWDIPSSRRVTIQAKDLGKDAYHEYVRRREMLKAEGLSPTDAYRRAAKELRIGERWKDWNERRRAGILLGMNVQLTPGEMKAAVPSYEPFVLGKAEEVGEEEMSLAEQIAWAKKWSARVQNGEEAPKRFPSEGALFWFQSAIANRRDFERVVLRVENPAVEGENLYLQDGQYQVKEIVQQLEEAVRECGEELLEMEAEFLGKYKGARE